MKTANIACLTVESSIVRLSRQQLGLALKAFGAQNRKV